MAGMQFEYDEEGGTFFYFLLSFWALLLVPFTFYYLWPQQSKSDNKDRRQKECNCDPCFGKRNRLKNSNKWQKSKEKAIKIGLFVGWIILIALAYKVSKIQMEFVEYDPYLELGIDRGASQGDIKKAYRKMSLKYHPDKETGDHKKFMKIAKAYAALTDEETKKNWEEFGNPDGPGVTRFGIALPKWIVERENSMLVLAAYGLLFMIILPVVVGVWWYRSIKFSKDQVLLDTTRLYYYFFQKNPNMMLKRVIMVLGASFEFDKNHNKEVIERPSDNEEVPQQIRRLPNVDDKNKEKPFCFPYSLKARTLLHAHFHRLDLPPSTLEVDKQYVLSKSPYLINEMINIIAQLVAGAARNAVQHMPRLDTVENCMKVSQMLIQGLDQRASPLLQLPHITPDMLKHFTTKKRNIQRITDLIAFKDEERRSLFRTLGADEYKDIMNVCATMPNVNMYIKSEVLDDEDSSITAGSIVTVTVTLTRSDMECLFDQEDLDFSHLEEEDVQELEHEENPENQVSAAVQAKKQPQKAAANKKGKQKKLTKKKKAPKQVYNWKAAASTETKETVTKQNSTSASESAENKGEEEDHTDQETDEEANNASESEDLPTKKTSNNKANAAVSESRDDEEEQWKKYQEEAKNETQLETKIKESYPAHCPYFPDEKQEGWWLYVGDKKSRMLITAPVQILTLKTTEEIQLKFSAPMKPGVYTYHVILRSDCYLDFDQNQKIRLDVKEAKLVDDHPQWDISEDEDDKKDEDSDSDYSTDMDESDDE